MPRTSTSLRSAFKGARPRSARRTGIVLGLAVVAACAGPVNLPTGPDAGVLLLVLRVPATDVPDAVYQGRVSIDQVGCLRLDPPERSTVVWPHGSGLVRDKTAVSVVDRSGKTLVRVGDIVRFGGGHVPDLEALDIVPEDLAAAASARCPGDFWIVGSVLPPVPR